MVQHGVVDAWRRVPIPSPRGGNARSVTPAKHLYERRWTALRLDSQAEYDAAFADVTSHLATHPEDAVAWHNRGVLREERGDRAGAIADYRQAMTVAPPAPVTHACLARCLRAMGRLAEASEEERHAAASTPPGESRPDGAGTAGVDDATLGRAVSALDALFDLEADSPEGRDLLRRVRSALAKAMGGEASEEVAEGEDAVESGRAGGAGGWRGLSAEPDGREELELDEEGERRDRWTEDSCGPALAEVGAASQPAPRGKGGRFAAPMVRRSLRCGRCQYELRGLRANGKCPECGQSIRSTLVAEGASPATSPWMFDLSDPSTPIRATLVLVVAVLLVLALVWYLLRA